MVVRFILWVLSLLLTAIPLIVSIAVTPSAFGDLFVAASYIGYQSEVLFIAVSLSAVTIAEIVELLFDLGRAEKSRRILSLLLFAILIVQVIVSAVWYGTFVERVKANGSILASELQAVLSLLDSPS